MPHNPPLAEENLLRRVRSIVISVMGIHRNAKDLTPHTDLFKIGALDSIGLVMVVVKLEQEFGVRVQLGDFNPKSLTTLEGITSLIDHAIRRADPETKPL